MNEHTVYIFDNGHSRSFKVECCFPVGGQEGGYHPCSKKARSTNKILCDQHTKLFTEVQDTWKRMVFEGNIDPVVAFNDKSISKMSILAYLVQKKLELVRFMMMSPYEVETGYQKWRWGVMTDLSTMMRHESSVPSVPSAPSVRSCPNAALPVKIEEHQECTDLLSL